MKAPDTREIYTEKLFPLIKYETLTNKVPIFLGFIATLREMIDIFRALKMSDEKGIVEIKISIKERI
jgi:hypothetical protein